ncbi:MAG: hypothetical protein M3N46_05225 [Actinomycetota bacterium]|nr:hypothetical protein [Actinomycetota bacterium]
MIMIVGMISIMIRIAGVLMLPLALAGCVSWGQATTPLAPTSARSSAVADQPDDDPSAKPAPVWDPASQLAAKEIAAAAVASFVDHHRSQKAWFAQLQPYLSFDAAQAYATVNPANVVGSRVTPNLALQPPTSVYLGTVLVPTDAGPYTVLLQRTDGASGWLVERITLGTGG